MDDLEHGAETGVGTSPQTVRHSLLTMPPLSDAAVTSHGNPRSDRLRRHAVNMALWTVQGWLAMFFIAAGWAKVSQPIDLLGELLVWPVYLGTDFTRVFGLVEGVLGLALIAPLASWALRPALMIAARTLLILTLVALTFHLLSGLPGFALLNLTLAGLCIVLIRGRKDPDRAGG